jgi:ABC-type transporter Mla maintaining outer membrane lipid asymmetry permease subunit MlaE
MKVNEEIDAMETMALDPIRFLVAPKLFAMLLMMPCLAIWADFMGFFGGSVFGIMAAGFTRRPTSLRLWARWFSAMWLPALSRASCSGS